MNEAEIYLTERWLRHNGTISTQRGWETWACASNGTGLLTRDRKFLNNKVLVLDEDEGIQHAIAIDDSNRAMFSFRLYIPSTVSTTGDQGLKIRLGKIGKTDNEVIINDRYIKIGSTEYAFPAAKIGKYVTIAIDYIYSKEVNGRMTVYLDGPAVLENVAIATPYKPTLIKFVNDKTLCTFLFDSLCWENFTNLSAGNGWPVIGVKNAGTIVTDIVYAGSKAAQWAEDAGNNKFFTQAGTNTIVLDFQFRCGWTDTAKNCSLNVKESDQTTGDLNLLFYPDRITWNVAPTQQTAISHSTWYNAQIIADPVAKTFDAYLNGVRQYNDIAITLAAPPFGGLAINSPLSFAGGKLGIDCMWIKENL